MKTRLPLILSATALCTVAASPAFAQGGDTATTLTSYKSAYRSVVADSKVNASKNSNKNAVVEIDPSTDIIASDTAEAVDLNDALTSANSTAFVLEGSTGTDIFDTTAANTVAADSSAATVAAAAAVAQGGSSRSESFSILLNQDSFFGFYPSFNGLIPIGDNIDFSFYGILWTNSGFSSTAFGPAGVASDNDLWTEFGAGVAIHTMDGNLVIKPQIGLTNGALLSSGVQENGVPTGTGGNFADGIVPSLTMNYSDDSFEAEFYGGYYAALRNRNDDFALDFLHTWINAGAKISDNFSAGAHYELLSNTRNTGGSTAVVYQWLGPYVQFSTSNGFFARFTAGADIEGGNDGDFYKLTAGFSF
ncbi:MAG: DUF6733 family protein [Pseudomonadota bacterium]